MDAVGACASIASAGLFYAATSQRHWRWLARLRRYGVWAGSLAAVLALFVWSRQLGFGAGLCVALSLWMLTAIVLPWLALATRRPFDDGEPH